VLAGLAAVTLIATMTTSGLQRPEAPGIAAPSAPRLSARDILLAAANQAAEAETGRYWHVQMIVLVGPYKVGTPPDQYYLLKKSVLEHWIARNPRHKSWLGQRDLGFRPRGEEDRQAWLEAGSPRQWIIPGGPRLSMKPGKPEFFPDDATNYLHDLGGFDFTQVQRLPTDPVQLRALFVARIAANPDMPPPGTTLYNVHLFEAMSELLLDVPASPRVRAAALTALAEIPGVHSTGEVKDADARTGLGIELTSEDPNGTSYQQLIFDATTHLVMASNNAYHADGEQQPIKESHSLVRKSEWTNETPVAPTIS
jgi:hypothetical protein